MLCFASSLRVKGSHTLLAMDGYYMKDNGEECFEFVHHNVSSNDMSEGKTECAKFGKVGLQNYVNLSHSNIMHRHNFVSRSIWISLVQKWIILSIPRMGNSIMVRRHGCEKSCSNLDDHDESL